MGALAVFARNGRGAAVLHRLHREQLIARPPVELWDFFATPRNLNLLTPPQISFEIRSEIPVRMFAGQLIEYRVGVLPGIRMRWVTEITHVRDFEYFVDEQRIGPYRIWHHEHRFVPQPDGRTVRMIDDVSYEVGWGPLGELLHKFWIRRQLATIFDYRAHRVSELFPTGAM